MTICHDIYVEWTFASFISHIQVQCNDDMYRTFHLDVIQSRAILISCDFTASCIFRVNWDLLSKLVGERFRAWPNTHNDKYTWTYSMPSKVSMAWMTKIPQWGSGVSRNYTAYIAHIGVPICPDGVMPTLQLNVEESRVKCDCTSPETSLFYVSSATKHIFHVGNWLPVWRHFEPKESGLVPSIQWRHLYDQHQLRSKQSDF